MKAEIDKKVEIYTKFKWDYVDYSACDPDYYGNIEKEGEITVTDFNAPWKREVIKTYLGDLALQSSYEFQKAKIVLQKTNFVEEKKLKYLFSLEDKRIALVKEYKLNKRPELHKREARTLHFSPGLVIKLYLDGLSEGEISKRMRMMLDDVIERIEVYKWNVFRSFYENVIEKDLYFRFY